MVDLTFIEKRSGNLLLYIIVIAIVLLLLFMVWPWKTALILTLWAGYVLWWPTVWLEKYIHRRGLAALIVIIVTGVILAFALINVTVIVAQELAQLVAGASASSNAQLSQGLTNTFRLANPDLARAGPIVALTSALAAGGAEIVTTFTQTAQGAVRNVLFSIPLLLAQLIIPSSTTLKAPFQQNIDRRSIDSWTTSIRSSTRFSLYTSLWQSFARSWRS
jgi:predicted PurR-regulated permease PerM